jgi:hypothetical protein
MFSTDVVLGLQRLLQLHAGSLAWQIGDVTRGDNRHEIFIDLHYKWGLWCCEILLSKCLGLTSGSDIMNGCFRNISENNESLFLYTIRRGHAWLKSTGHSKQVYPVKLKTSFVLHPKPKLTCRAATQSVMFHSSLVNCNFFHVRLVFNFAELLAVLQNKNNNHTKDFVCIEE